MFGRIKTMLAGAAILAAGAGAGGAAGAAVHQRADRRHLGRLLPARRRALRDLRRRASRARARRCRRPRPRSRTSTCCSRARARSPSRSAIASSAAGEGDTEAGFPGKLDKLRGIAAIYPNYIQIVASAGVRHQDARRPQGQEPVGRRADVRHRAQRPRHLRRRRHELRGPRQGRVPALRRIGRADQEPPARRHAAVGRPRRRLDPRPRDLGADHRRRGARRRSSRRSARPIVPATIPAGTYEGQAADVADGGGRQLPRHPRRRVATRPSTR